MFALRKGRVIVAVFLLVCVVVWCIFTHLTAFNSGEVHRQKTPVVPSSEPKRVLVTGVAGFIGFHLAKELIRVDGIAVVGLDNFNDYYDPLLKKDRAFILHNLGVNVYHEDLCHVEFLEDIFAKYNFTHVTHLAAQAGVRYSLKNPLAYVRANVECQVALLEVVRKYPHIKLVYASSSSVYGKHTPVPFKLTARTDRPGNMYAATKETDELLASYYCQAYKMSAVGLRFFTVYGPWGRPDMATYKFAEAIIQRKDVPMFHVSDDKPLARDFTYIDDIISGITMAMDYIPAECGEKFNLGFGKPLSVPALIDILEKELDLKANIKHLPLPPSEILKTWADTSVSKELLHFQPNTDLQQGVKKFVAWLKQYIKDRDDKTHIAKLDAWFAGLLMLRDKRDAIYENKKILKHNLDLQARLAKVQQRYTDWANAQGIHVPVICKVRFKVNSQTHAFNQTCSCQADYKLHGRDCLPVYNKFNVAMAEQMFPKEAKVISEMKKGKHMIHFKGLLAQGGDYMYAPSKNYNTMKETCIKDKLCIAVTTGGLMKRQVPTKETWKLVDYVQDIFVFDIDYCSLGEYKCPSNSSCTRVAMADYQCVCQPPLIMNAWHQCVTRLSPTPLPTPS